MARSRFYNTPRFRVWIWFIILAATFLLAVNLFARRLPVIADVDNNLKTKDQNWLESQIAKSNEPTVVTMTESPRSKKPKTFPTDPPKDSHRKRNIFSRVPTTTEPPTEPPTTEVPSTERPTQEAPTEPPTTEVPPTEQPKDETWPPKEFIGNPPIEIFDLTRRPAADVEPLLKEHDLTTQDCKDMLQDYKSVWPRQVSALLLGIGLRSVKENAETMGGPMGEFVFFMGVAQALLCSGHRVAVADTIEQLENVSLDQFDVFFSERNWIGTPEVFHKLGISAKYPCRARFLDYYGISSRFMPEPFGVRQVLTTYPYTTGNDFIGLPIRSRLSPENNLKEREPCGIIWGKEPKYFLTPQIPAILNAFNNTPLFATINTVKLESTPVDLPPHVNNLGTISRTALLKLFQTCTFLIGLGDPVLGPTALEAVANGAIFFNPLRRDRVACYNWDDPIDSQLPYLASIGKPYVYTYDMDKPEQLKPMIDEIMRSKPSAPHPLPDFSLRSVGTKLLENILDPSVCPKQNDQTNVKP